MLFMTAPGRAFDFPPRKDGTMRKRKAFGPERAAELNPFLSLMEDWMTSPGGYVEHIHRGYESVTLVLGGAVACCDHSGRRAVLEPGDVQWTTMGHGLSHSELPHGEGEAHLLQLWVNLPAAQKGCAARTQEVRAADIPVVTGPGLAVRVIAGALGEVTGPAQTVHPVRLLEARLEQGAVFEVPVPAGQVGLLYVLSGDLTAGTHALAAGATLHLVSKLSDTLPLAALGPVHLLLMTAPPLAEPVEVSGPFILNTKAEVKRAYDDFRGGLFERPVPARE